MNSKFSWILFLHYYQELTESLEVFFPRWSLYKKASRSIFYSKDPPGMLRYFSLEERKKYKHLTDLFYSDLRDYLKNRKNIENLNPLQHHYMCWWWLHTSGCDRRRDIIKELNKQIEADYKAAIAL